MSSTTRLPALSVVHQPKLPCNFSPKATACQVVSTLRVWVATRPLQQDQLLCTGIRNTMITADSHLARSPQTRSAHSVRRLATSWSRSSAVAHQEKTAMCPTLGSLMSSIDTQLEQADGAIATTGNLNIELAKPIWPANPVANPIRSTNCDSPAIYRSVLAW